MKFGATPVSEAEGAILAHSVRNEGVRLRKGLILEAAHIETLQNAGIESVIAARLGPDDSHEDAAAQLVAEALIGEAQDGLRADVATTGRVNLIAERPGVLRIDGERITAANLVNPLINIATLPPFQQVAPGDIAATVKIVSYGLPTADVKRAAESGRAALRLAQPVIRSASLIITEVDGRLGEKGRIAIEGRLKPLGIALERVVTVPHKQAAITAALSDAPGELVLILTASATSDPTDVAPEAVRNAGGEVLRFGMPVDPGNLLFIGRLDTRPVIGLPGCARSPALNGADWVLSRVACGVDVGRDELAAMGVGGLLKETAMRGHPRAGRKRDH
ncbi:molybdopterin-binding protein [Aquicoccus sp. G2-2]|uniref:molybdopterin-binding protein n=1 Tax=Aquicoccus sp. G2-2 TaxID=3092120 RepID=UPI002ADFC117|nr:molybdopterin-binding protein [Aquicoccus sp. G2-2]MEA1112940.1 molybdopterin-binding protein [Aquicoccus sp. G2-2]